MKQSLIERIDEIRANSISDEEYQKIHGESIDESVKKLMKSFDEKLEKYKPKDD